MTPAEFSHLLHKLEHLTDKQRQQLKLSLSEQDPIQKIIIQLEQRLIENPECPHCHSYVINRFGNLKSHNVTMLNNQLQMHPKYPVEAVWSL